MVNAKQPYGHSLGLSEFEETVKNANIDRKSVKELATGIATDNLEKGGYLSAAKKIAEGRWYAAAPYLANAYKNYRTALRAGFEVLSGNPGEATAEIANEALKLAAVAASEGINLITRIFTNEENFENVLRQVFDSRVGAKEDFIKMVYQLKKIEKKDPKAKEHINRWVHQLREAHKSGDVNNLIAKTRHVLKRATNRLKKLGVDYKIPHSFIEEIESPSSGVSHTKKKKKRMKTEYEQVRVDAIESKEPELVNSKIDQGPRKKVKQVKPQTYSDTPRKRQSSTKKKTAEKSMKRNYLKFQYPSKRKQQTRRRR